MPLAVRAQNTRYPELVEVLEELSVTDSEKGTSFTEEALMELSERMEQPFNVNTVTREQLESLPFLTAGQIENILAYLYIHGEMKTLYEFQLIDGIDRRTIEYLIPFFCVLEVEKKPSIPRIEEVVKYGKHELLTRLDIPFYRRKGYEYTYLGTPNYHSLRYSFRYRDNLYAGLTGEKDSGEPFGALHNRKGYDSYSFHLLVKNIGCIKTLAVGDYRVGFGQGLVVNTGFMLGKVASASAFRYLSNGINRHTSTDETSYFRGVAATVALGKPWEVSAFYSHRLLDGKESEGVITSIDKTGLHRSEAEVKKKHTVALQVMGGNITYGKEQFRVGVTGLYYDFSKPYEPELRTYSKYNLHGRTFYNIGADYQYRWCKFTLQGEVAIGKKGFAALNRVLYSPLQTVQLMLLHRYYAHDYWAMFARSFAESGMQNENGWYVAGEIRSVPYWTFFVSVDLFSFPWWKYRISKPSQGMEGVFKAVFSPAKKWNFTVDYRYQRKERDVTGTGGKEIMPVYHHKLRYRFNYQPNSSFTLRTTLDANTFQHNEESTSYGYQLTQAASYRFLRSKMEGALQGSYFHTDDYDARVYIPERGLLHSFYTPSFQGEGVRFSFRLRYDINARWMVLGKYGQTIYFDRDKIGSGNDLIRGNKKADVQLQLRFKF